MAPSHPSPDVAFLTHTGFFGIQISSLHVPCDASSSRTTRMSSTAQPFRFPRRVKRAVVWFREGDLRVEDHPGLDSACAHTSDALAPLLVCTPRTNPETLDAVRRLRKELEDRGSHLFLRYGEDEALAVVEFLEEFRADRVHVHMDVEHHARYTISAVERALDGKTTVQTWNSELREWDDDSAEFLAGLPSEYPRFLRWPMREKIPVQTSSAEFLPNVILPGPDLECNKYTIESIADEIEKEGTMTTDMADIEKRFQEDQKLVRALSLDSAMEGFGEQTLMEFLRRSDAYEEPDLGRSLSEVFRQGALSPYRVYEIVHNHERRNGRIWRPLYREGSKAILNWLEAREFATLMARRDLGSRETVDGEHLAKFWRWKGFLVRYVEEGQRSNGLDSKPPLLLVHGFGASSQHFRRSLRVLKERYHVFALDLIGFGRSEKPPTQYTQALWEKLLWDFVADVIRQPVFVAGNSIGGYLSCAFGVDAHPTLCAGICLINSAGKLVDTQVPPPSVEKKDGFVQYVAKNSRFARSLFGNFLLRSLQGRVDKTLKMVYPKNPDAADEELAREIKRNSQDFGASEVIASGLILPQPRSLSTLLAKYSGPLLVFQGELDPLNNARKRADTIQEQYPNATMVRVQAGHCPHEEVSDQFVKALSSWMDSISGKPAVFAETHGVESSAS